MNKYIKYNYYLLIPEFMILNSRLFSNTWDHFPYATLYSPKRSWLEFVTIALIGKQPTKAKSIVIASLTQFLLTYLKIYLLFSTRLGLLCMLTMQLVVTLDARGSIRISRFAMREYIYIVRILIKNQLY